MVDGTLAIKRKENLINCSSLCPADVATILPALHILTGSDTTTAFYGHGKKTLYNKGTATDDARQLLSEEGKHVPVNQKLIDDISLFTIRYVYNDKVSTSLGELEPVSGIK